MEYITPESLGGAGVSLGVLLLWTLIRVIRKIGELADKGIAGASTAGEALTALGEHLKEEKRHHAVVEASGQEQVESLHRLERAFPSGPHPRVVTGDHTPIPVPPV